MNFRKLLISMLLLVVAGSVQAIPTMVNFQTMADGAYGESAWDTLSLKADFGVDVDISGVHGTADAYAYLDKGTAGLGVCRSLNSTGAANVNTKQPGSGINLCASSSDDNVNAYGDVGESLNFVFNENLTVTRFWLNNNHDPDYGMDGDTVTIGGIDFTFSGPADDADLGWLFEFSGTDGMFSASDVLNIGYYSGTVFRGEEFYVSAMEFAFTVPEPGVLGLLALGLAGIGAARRSQNG